MAEVIAITVEPMAAQYRVNMQMHQVTKASRPRRKVMRAKLSQVRTRCLHIAQFKHERKTFSWVKIKLISYLSTHNFFPIIWKEMAQNFSTWTPDKPDNSTANVNTSTQSRNFNLILVLNNLTNPTTALGSSSSDWDIEVLHQDKLNNTTRHQRNSSRSFHFLLNFPASHTRS